MTNNNLLGADFWTLIENAEKNDDLDTIDRLLAEGFIESSQSHRPFSAALELEPNFREQYFTPLEGGAEAGFAGSLAIEAANRASRARRRIAYRLKTSFGFDGIRLVEEGDSWTQYPIFLKDIVDQLSDNKDIAIYSVGAAGDLISKMADKKEYIEALRETGAQGLLLSGAGNDLFDDFGRLLNQYDSSLSPEQHLNQAIWEDVFGTVVTSYETIINDIAVQFPEVQIFGHGYDLPFPEDDGSWIGPPLIQKGIPLDVGRDILKVIMDRFNDALTHFASRNSNFIFNDLRGVVDRGRPSWYDELHPKNTGYSRAAKVFEESIRQHFSGGAEGITTSPFSSHTGGTEQNTATGQRTIVLDPGHGGPSLPPKVGGSSWNNAVGSNGTLEKTLTLDVAKRTRDILRERGFSVKLTRETDVNLGLENRAKVAKDISASAFISIHFNGSENHNAQGTETFVHSRLSSASTGRESKSLCLAVQAEMVDALGLDDRNSRHAGGIKYGGYGVLRPDRHARRTASILHEVSFLDRADEERKLNKVSYRRKIATALADGIEAYLDTRFPSAESFAGEPEIGDAIELAALAASGSGTVPIVETEFTTTQSDGGVIDIDQTGSNGHMIAEGDFLQQNFLHRLAAYEADRISKEYYETSFSEGEGDEPDEFDPMIEQTFSQISANSENNLALLRNLFGDLATAHTNEVFETSGVDFDLSDFLDYIESLNLRHFSATEFLVKGANNNPGGRGAGLNTNPPRGLWKNIGNTAKMLDEIRRRLGAPVYILSVYRSPAYNDAIDGASQSRHMKFDAIDWHSTIGNVHDWLAVAQEVSESNPAAFQGWMKAYTGSNFVHIDTRRRTINL